MFEGIRGAARLLKRNVSEELDRANGKARSHARMILGARFIPEVMKALHTTPVRTKIRFGQRAKGRGPFIATKIAGSKIRMLDGRQYVFFTDGSLRHAFGRAVGKMAVKAAKRAKRLKAYRTRGPVTRALTTRLA